MWGPASYAQSLERGAHARGLQQRLRRRPGGASIPGVAGVADGRLGAAPGVLQRCGRTQADLRTHQPLRRRAGGLVAGHPGHLHPHRRGCNSHAGGDGRPRPAGLFVFEAARAGLWRRGRFAAVAPSHRRRSPVFLRESRRRGQEAYGGHGGTACQSRGGGRRRHAADRLRKPCWRPIACS